MPDELSDCCVLHSIISLSVTAAVYGLEPSTLGCEASVEPMCYPLAKVRLKNSAEYSFQALHRAITVVLSVKLIIYIY
jgi:hypothetical protein